MSELTKQYLTVEALTKYIKYKFEVDPHLQKVFVVGEVSNYRPRPNGHQYFSLKDNKARINAVMYRNAFARLPFKLEEGMKVLAVGRITVYEPNGSYQLTIESIEPDGIGALYQALEQLKQKFKQAGLFDLPKKSLPRFPQNIAVITSPTGAVIRDILTTIERRYPIVGVTVFPTRVQGKEAAAEIAAAFAKVKEREAEFDAIILARGGGSIEDLWCFNEEQVAYAIIASNIPVISSIGHETDTTLADLVADQRAATPTAAAELAVPVLEEILIQIRQYEERLYLAITGKLQLLNKQYERYSKSYVMLDPERLYQPYSQQLDMTVTRLKDSYQRYMQRVNNQTETLAQRLSIQQPTRRIQQSSKELGQLIKQLYRQMTVLQTNKNHQLSTYVQLLDAFSPLKSMQRGYAVVHKEEQVVKSTKQVSVNDELIVNLQDGTLKTTVTEINQTVLINQSINKE